MDCLYWCYVLFDYFGELLGVLVVWIDVCVGGEGYFFVGLYCFVEVFVLGVVY